MVFFYWFVFVCLMVVVLSFLRTCIILDQDRRVLCFVLMHSSLIFSLQDNFKLMCTNAMIYNKPETIYYKAAKKLLHSGMKILSQVKEILCHK